MNKTCSKCGLSDVLEINVEMTLARGKAEPVYALGRPIVCLGCGQMECSLPRECLAKLREAPQV